MVFLFPAENHKSTSCIFLYVFMAKASSKNDLRIFHGPVNIGGLGRRLADYEREQGFVSDFYVYRDHELLNNAHQNLNLQDFNLFIRFIKVLSFFINCLRKYNIFHFYFGRTFFPFNLDLPILKLFGKKLIMTYCGTEVRLMEVEEKRNPYYDILVKARTDSNDPRSDFKKKLMMAWENIWVDKFFSIRTGFAWANAVIPRHKIISDIQINNSVDVKKYSPGFKLKKIPSLVHAPTNPTIKGSEFIEKAISELEAEGLQFKYIRINKMSFDDVQRILREDADLLVDQLILGDFGCLAVESMFYGVPVCCFVVEDSYKAFEFFPIVNCNIDNIKEVLRKLIIDPEERLRLGKLSRKFVETYFDRDIVFSEVLKVYQDLIN